MSWESGAAGGWQQGADAGDSQGWDGGAVLAPEDTVNGFGHGDGGGGDNACRICGQDGHFARDCPEKPEGGGLTGECYNCGEVGHNKADCPNPRVEHAFTGTCHGCGEEGHQARDCPSNPMTCKLCGKPGHKAVECKERRLVNWDGVPEIDAETAWTGIVEAAKKKDLDTFRICLRAYARAIDDAFNLTDIERALRDADLPVFLIAKEQEIATNTVIVGLTGEPEMKYVLSVQLTEKPRRAKMAQGWPENHEQNLERLGAAGFVQDRGVPVCANCGELGHVKKHCNQEVTELEAARPTAKCVYCQEEGHRARDCPKERINPHVCRNCKQEGHNSKECPEPRSAENVECRKCSQMGHFSKDCPNVAPRTCRNCGSEDHIAKECDQPRNMALVTCRNCEKQGHMSKECPEPTDWSKVQCRNCGEFGHTIKRCKAPVAEDGGAGDGGDGGGWGATVDTAAAASSGEASWGGGDAVPDAGGDAGGSGPYKW